MRALALAACLAIGSACAAEDAKAATITIPQLFEMLARERPPRATYHERKFMALLDRPIESTGELAFTPPDTLEKRTLTPKPERLTVDRERMTLERGGKRHSLGLRENPAVAVLVESIRATLAGDLDALTRAYSVALEGSAAQWKLTLRPLYPAAAQLVEQIHIAGAEARVQSVEILQADGDRSLMTITPAAR